MYYLGGGVLAERTDFVLPPLTTEACGPIQVQVVSQHRHVAASTCLRSSCCMLSMPRQYQMWYCRGREMTALHTICLCSAGHKLKALLAPTKKLFDSLVPTYSLD